MKNRNNQAGFSGFELFLLLAVAAIIGLGGYFVYNRNKNQTPNASSQMTAVVSSTPSATANVAAAPNINSTSDLDKAAAVLDQTDPGSANSSDSALIDTQSASF